jgi:hypothetical protein
MKGVKSEKYHHIQVSFPFIKKKNNLYKLVEAPIGAVFYLIDFF